MISLQIDELEQTLTLFNVLKRPKRSNKKYTQAFKNNIHRVAGEMGAELGAEVGGTRYALAFNVMRWRLTLCAGV